MSYVERVQKPTKACGKPLINSRKADLICSRDLVVLKSFELVPSLFLIP